MPAKKESIQDLKKQLENLQERIADYESPGKSVVEIKELYTWSSPERIFIPRDKKWFTYIIMLVMLITLVLLFLQQFIIIAPVMAIAFVAYVLASVPPQTVEHKISTQGLTTDNHSYLWNELSDFWFTSHHKEDLLNIDTYLNFPRRLTILIGKGEKEKIQETLVQYLPYREVPKTTWLDRAAEWLSNKFHKLAS